MKANSGAKVRVLPNLLDGDKQKIINGVFSTTNAAGITTWENKGNVADKIQGNANLKDQDKSVLITEVITGDVALAEKRAAAFESIRVAPNLTTDDVNTLRGNMLKAGDSMLKVYTDQGALVNAIRGNNAITADDQAKLVAQALAGTKATDVTFMEQKASAITAIRENKTLLPADQDALVKLVLDATSSDALTLTNQKATEMTKVRNMKNLTDTEKNQLTKAISAGKTKTEVSELANKAAAMDEIRGRKITDTEKNTLNEGVFKAVEGSGLPILGWGKVTVDEQVGAAKGKATMVEEVRGKKNLTPAEKERISKVIMEAGSKDIADFEIERAKFIDDLRGMDTLTPADKDLLAAKMGKATDKLDLEFTKQKALKIQNARKSYNKLTPQQMEKFVTEIHNSKTVPDYDLADTKASAVNKINGMDALTQSEKNVFIKEITSADSPAKVQKILDRANKLHEEMKAIGGSKLDLDITNDVKVKYPQTDRNIKLESLSVRYIQKNKETNKDGRVMLNAHVRVPWGLNIQQLISNEGIYLQIPHTLGTDFEVEFIQNGQKQKVKWDPAGGTWRMETGGMLIVSGNEDLEIRVSFKPKKLEKSDFLTIGYERQKNIIDTWLTGGINDQIIIEFGDAAEDINNLHDANQGVDKIIDDAVTDEEKKDAQDLRDELDEITNSEDLKDFLDKIEKLQELKDAKDKAKETLENLHNLSKEEKDAFIDQINKGTSLEDIQRVVDEAKAKDAQNLAEAQKEAKDAIQALPNLTDEEKKAFQDKINGLDKISEMNPVLDEALAQDEQNLKTEQDRAIENITDNMTNLKDNQKKPFIDRINEAKTLDEVKAIEKEAQDLNDKIKIVEDKLNSGELDLHDTELEKLIEDLGKVTTPEEADAILKEAETLDGKNKAETEALNKAIQDAKDAIDKMDYLSDKEKQDFKELLDATGTLQDVADVLKDATTKNEENKKIVDKAVQDAKDAIDKMVNLSDKEKQDFKDALDNVRDIKNVQPILDEAAKKDAENLKAAQDKGKQDIDAMNNLSKEEKDAFKAEIDATKDKKNVQPIVDKAQKQNDLNKLKEDANKIIDGLDNVDKDKLKDQIKDATTEEEVNKIVEDAKKDDAAKQAEKDKVEKDPLDKAKDEANKVIDTLPNVDKDKLKEDIKDATTEEEINKIVEDAKKDDAAKQAEKDKAEQDAKDALDKSKDDAKKEIDKLPSLKPEDKDKIKDAIDKAEDGKAIDKIVDDAKEADKNANKDNNTKPDEIGQTPLINLIIKSGDKILLNISDVVNTKDPEHEEWKHFVENTHAFENHVRQWGKKHGYDLTDVQVREIQVLMSMLMSEPAAKSTSFENGKAYEVVVEMTPIVTTDDKEDSNKPNVDGKEDSNKPNTDGKTDSNKSTDSQNGQGSLDQNKSDAHKSIDKLNNLSDDEKSKFKSDINKQDTTDSIEELVAQANKLNADKMSGETTSTPADGNSQQELPNTGAEDANTTAALAGIAALIGTMGTFFRRKKDND